jgi:hypothetical protein
MTQIFAAAIGVCDGAQEFDAVIEMPGPDDTESRVRQADREGARAGVTQAGGVGGEMTCRAQNRINGDLSEALGPFRLHAPYLIIEIPHDRNGHILLVGIAGILQHTQATSSE